MAGAKTRAVSIAVSQSYGTRHFFSTEGSTLWDYPRSSGFANWTSKADFVPDLNSRFVFNSHPGCFQVLCIHVAPGKLAPFLQSRNCCCPRSEKWVYNHVAGP